MHSESGLPCSTVVGMMGILWALAIGIFFGNAVSHKKEVYSFRVEQLITVEGKKQAVITNGDMSILIPTEPGTLKKGESLSLVK